MEAVIPVRLSGTLLEDVSQEATRNGMSAEDWLIWLAMERMRELEVTRRFFSRSLKDSDGKRLLEILNSTRGDQSYPGDEF